MELKGSKIDDNLGCLLEKFTSDFNMFTNKYMDEEINPVPGAEKPKTWGNVRKKVCK